MRNKSVVALTALTAVLSVTPVLSQQRRSTSPRTTAPVNSLFEILRYTGSGVFNESGDGLTPRKRWINRLEEYGLQRKPGDRELWILADATGEIRVSAIFAPEDRSAIFSLLYFPAENTSISDTLLSHLLAKASHTVMTIGNELEIVFPEIQIARGDGFRQNCRRESNSLSVRLTGSALVRQSRSIECETP